MKINFKTAQSPIFIVGVGRSGTSLVQSMLASNSELAFLPETAFFRKFVVPKKLEKLYKRNPQVEFNQIVSKEESVQRIKGIDVNSITLENCSEPDIGFYLELQKLNCEMKEVYRFGDKDPRLIEFLPVIKEKIGGAFIVNVIRDPRDILVSKKKAAWSAGRTTIFYAFANRVQIRLSQYYGKLLFGDKYIEIIYEELISEPEQTLIKLCKALNLNFENNMLSFSQQAKKLVSSKEMSWKKETIGPLLKNNKNKWENSLSDYEVALMELSNSEAFNIGKYRYSNAFKQLNTLNRIKCLAEVVAINALTPLYIIYRKISSKV